tara:strand:+ start:343 stop:546 length:204 start_codon:yes stop_codon:yes gene_type:complete
MFLHFAHEVNPSQFEASALILQNWPSEHQDLIPVVSYLVLLLFGALGDSLSRHSWQSLFPLVFIFHA